MCARCSTQKARGAQQEGEGLAAGTFSVWEIFQKPNISTWLALQVVEWVWNKGYMGVGRCPVHLRQQNKEQKRWHMACAEAGAAVTAEWGRSLSSHLQHPLLPLTSDTAVKFLRRAPAPGSVYLCEQHA